MTLLPLHILAGTAGLVSGAVALYASKGGKLHRKSGMLFVYAMLVMSGSAAVLAMTLKPNGANVLQGVLTFYLVVTGLLTVRRRPAGFHWIDLAAMLVALAVGVTHFTFAFEALNSVTGKKYGYPPPLYFIFGSLALFAASGDTRMMISRGLEGSRRLARHLWRMTFALFIATSSFFLGQAKVFPKALRITPLLLILALLPLAVMVYWLVRVSSKGREVVVLQGDTGNS